MKKQNIFTAILAVTFIFLSACKKDDDNGSGGGNTEQPGTVEVEFSHDWGHDNELTFGNNLVHSETGDTLSFTMIKYYISNIKLKKADGSEYIQPESYYLIDAADPAKSSIQIPNVPPGNYVGITYTIGVDSIRNVSGAQEGALSTSNNMFWSWNTGYIFFKIEANSPQSPNGKVKYHVGGFSGANNAIRSDYKSFGTDILNVNGPKKAKIHFHVDMEHVWHDNTTVNSLNDIHMPGANAAKIANHFKSAFELDHIHN